MPHGKTSRASSDFIPCSGSAIRVQHVFADKTSCWLGNTRQHKEKGAADGAGEEQALVHVDAHHAKSFQLAFTSERGDEDALIVLDVSESEQADLEVVRSIVRCAQTYRRHIMRGTSKLTDNHTAEAEAMLSACIHFTTTLAAGEAADDGAGGATSGGEGDDNGNGAAGDGDSLLDANQRSGGGGGGVWGGDALLEANGPPKKRQQKMCADMKVQ